MRAKESKTKMKKLSKAKIYLAVLAILAANFAVLLPKVSASTLTKTSILEIGGTGNPMIASGGESFALDFKTVGAGATTASVNFNNFTGGTVNAAQSISSTGCTTYFPNATLLPGSLSASGSGTTISISSITALSATTEYCTILTSTSAITNPGSAGVYSALVTVGSDSQTAGFDVLSAGANAYSITGTVGQTFTMSLSGTTDSFGSNLSASAPVASTGITATVSTNAASGWSLYAKDSNAGLNSSSAGHLIPSVSAGSNADMTALAGSEKYALGVSANNTANYAYTSSTHGGALSSSAYNQVATSSSSGTNVTQVLHELADISATTPPATDYTDTITVIGTGSF
jgi:hypothetical protein